jgi:hypothetical protein
MKKFVKTLMLMSLAIIMCLTSMPIYASEMESGISPRLTHTNGASYSFDATPSIGYIYAGYTGVEATFVSAKLTVKVEKQFLFFFWNEVDTWESTATDLDGRFYYEMPLTGAGTYRATFTLEVTGTDGTVDVLDTVIENAT